MTGYFFGEQGGEGDLLSKSPSPSSYYPKIAVIPVDVRYFVDNILYLIIYKYLVYEKQYK
jgi:hypothetical protein